MDAAYHTECDALNTHILQNLVSSTPINEVKEQIQLYTVQKEDKQIKRDLSSSDMKDLIQTGEFLKIPNSKQIKTKITLVTKIIQAIENHLMQKCGECTQYYSIAYGTTPVLSCRKCGQGAHSHCYDDHQARTGITLIYTCSSCVKTNQPVREVPVADQQQNINLDDEEVEDFEVVNREKKESSPAPEFRPPPYFDNSHITAQNAAASVERNMSSAIVPPVQQSNDRSALPEKVQICRLYESGRCRRREDCKFKHPPRCKFMISTGRCRKGAACNFQHPKMCYGSVKDKLCTKEDCQFFHIRGTSRTVTNLRTVTNSNTPLPWVTNPNIQPAPPAYTGVQQTTNAQQPFLGQMDSRMQQLEDMMKTMMQAMFPTTRPPENLNTPNNGINPLQPSTIFRR